MFDPPKIAWFRTQEDGWFWLWTLSRSNQNHWNPQQAVTASARLQPVKAESPSEDPPCDVLDMEKKLPELFTDSSSYLECYGVYVCHGH